MYKPLPNDALLLRRYTVNWAAPDDRKINPWDINEPDPNGCRNDGAAAARSYRLLSRERQHLRYRARVDPKAPHRFPLTDPLYVNRSPYLPV
jgi:hypothetical protein